MATTVDMEGFSLGTPALVCRWRLAGGTLPLENRHIRALSRRTVDGKPLPAPLISWVKQHIEWTLKSGSLENPDGTLMVIVDEHGCAAMTVGPYEPLLHPAAGVLTNRALDAAKEAEATGVAPESLWVVSGSWLLLGARPDQPSAGTTSLVEHLAGTLGIQVERRNNLINEVLTGTIDTSEGLFLASDEHGIVVASDVSSPRAERLAGAYQRLLNKARR